MATKKTDSNKYKKMLISKLIPYDKNSRLHSEEQIDQVARSIQEFGFLNPVLIDENKQIIAGHCRVIAASRIDMTHVPVVEIKHLTDAQKKAYVIADNKLALNAEWDMDILQAEIESLKIEEFDIDLLGFDEIEMGEMFVMPEHEPEDIDSIPEVPKKPKAKTGDLYILGNHRLLCGDATDANDIEFLMDGKKADMVFTDPPYGVDYDGGHAVNGIRRDKISNDKNSNIYNQVLPLIHAFSKQKSALYLWFSDSHSAAVIAAVIAAEYKVRNTLIWNKNVAQFGSIGAQYKCKHEPFLYCFKSGKTPFWSGSTNEVSVWDIPRASVNEFHPTQKPTELAERAITNSSMKDNVVLDLFGGSGSTLIACEKTNRKCYMMEIDPGYIDVIVTRWENFTGEKAVCIPAKKKKKS